MPRPNENETAVMEDVTLELTYRGKRFALYAGEVEVRHEDGWIMLKTTEMGKALNMLVRKGEWKDGGFVPDKRAPEEPSGDD